MGLFRPLSIRKRPSLSISMFVFTSYHIHLKPNIPKKFDFGYFQWYVSMTFYINAWHIKIQWASSTKLVVKKWMKITFHTKKTVEFVSAIIMSFGGDVVNELRRSKLIPIKIDFDEWASNDINEISRLATFLVSRIFSRILWKLFHNFRVN